MHLGEIPGQDKVKEYFSKFVKDSRVPHALLLTGPKGSGKLALALGLAQLLLCKNITEGQACGECPSCNKTNKLIHPDLHFTYPVIGGIAGKKREDIISNSYAKQWRSFVEQYPFGDLIKWGEVLDAGDKPFNINVKDCNQVMTNLSLQSFEGGYKVQIIWNAEYLGKDSNRLLKLIEEPTDKTIIILITDNQEDLLNTILSRCQIVQVAPFTDQSVSDYLKTNHQTPDSKLEEVVYLVSGNMDYAIDLVEGSGLDLSDMLLDWLRVSYKAHPGPIVDWVNIMLKEGKNSSISFFKYGLHFFREYIKSIYLGDIKTLRFSAEEKNTVLKMHQFVDVQKAEQLIQLFDKCIYHMGRNANARLLFMHSSFEIGNILKTETPVHA